MRNGSDNDNKKMCRILGLTEPEEAEGPYQDHFFLVLCEKLAISAMMGDDTTRKGLRNQFTVAPRGGKNPGPEERVIPDLQHHQRTDGQNCD